MKSPMSFFRHNHVNGVSPGNGGNAPVTRSLRSPRYHRSPVTAIFNVMPEKRHFP